MIGKGSGEQETAEFWPDRPGNYPSGMSLLTAVDVASATHQGHVRKINEDHYLVIRFGRSLQNLTTNLQKGLLAGSYDLTGYGIFVADGMGGMAGGQIASRLALTKLVELLVDTPDWIMSLDRDEDASIVLQRVKDRFMRIDETLRAEAEQYRNLQGMGTTLTVAGTLGNQLVIGHIGDSRAYLLRGGKITQLTTDHTFAQALIDAGVAKPGDPATRSMRHVLTAALGSLGDTVQPQVHRLRLFMNDQLLLCTDGLTEMVEDKTITSVLQGAASAEIACRTLVDLALAAGGLDNITVVVARFGPSESALSFQSQA